MASFLTTHMVGSRPVKSLRPTEFAKLREAVTGTGRSLRSQADLIQAIRYCFDWAVGMQLVDSPVDYGPRFKRPGSGAIEREREASGKNRFIDREDVLALLGVARPSIRCMILLGINCGFYVSDSISLTRLFRRLQVTAEVEAAAGAGMGSLRHTYGTVVDLSADQKMIDLTMGHASKGMRKSIYSQLNLGELDRLATLAETVRRWLYFGEIAGMPGVGTWKWSRDS